MVMSLENVLAVAATVILSLGGGGAIVLGLSDWIGKILAGRYVEKLKHELQEEIEIHKAKLRKSEFLFQREFDAVSQFLALRRRLLPRYTFPEMEWDDACENFARDFAKVEKELDSYLSTHGAALGRSTLDRLSTAIGWAASGKFEVSGDTVSREGIKAAEKLMEELEAIEKELHHAVWSQSSV